MSTTLNAGQDIRFKSGWIILLIAAGLMTLNHVSGIFYLGIRFCSWATPPSPRMPSW